jgi:hypothetical protein
MRSFVIAELTDSGEVSEKGVVVSEALLRSLANICGAVSDRTEDNQTLSSIDIAITSILDSPTRA